MINKIGKGIILLSSFLLFSCNELTQSIKDTLNPVPKKDSHTLKEKSWDGKEITTNPPVSLKVVEPIAKSVHALQEAESSLRSLPQFEGKEIFVYRSAHFYNDGRIILGIQDPMNPSMVDKYTYKDGKWQDIQPVRITKADRLEDYLVALDNAPFVRVNKVYEAIQQVGQEIGSDEAEVIVYFVAHKGRVRWYPTQLRTERSRYSLTFDEEGNFISFEQD